MKKEKVYVIIDKETNELISYIDGDELVFAKKKKDVLPEHNAKVVEAILEIKIKGIDY